LGGLGEDGADWLELAFLEDAELLDLQIGRQLADPVEDLAHRLPSTTRILAASAYRTSQDIGRCSAVSCAVSLVGSDKRPVLAFRFPVIARLGRESSW